MKPRSLLTLFAAWSLATPMAFAFPPAPHHTFYGVVRNDHGTPLGAGAGTIILSSDSTEIARVPVDPSIGPGINYTLHVSMDAGTLAQLYTPTAMRPTMPFTIRVEMGATSYVPLEIDGKAWTIGQPGERTRLDLTLGVDSDRDGIPDAWERDIIDSDPNDGYKTLADVKPGDDADNDGLTNLQEYLAGTYALDELDGVAVEVVNVTGGIAQLRFLAVTGRTYRLRSSTDNKTWRDQVFSVKSTGEDPIGRYRAIDVRTLNVYVPWANSRGGFFQLFAE